MTYIEKEDQRSENAITSKKSKKSDEKVVFKLS